jgi:protein SOK2
MYSAPQSQPTQYHAQAQQMMPYRPHENNSYMKNDMAPPARAAEQIDLKAGGGMLQQSNDQGSHPTGGEEGENDNDNTAYTHTSAPYNSNRGTYPYGSSAAPGSMHGDHLSPEVTGSPHQNGSGRQTPRTAAPGPAQWNSNYPAAHRQSNLYGVMTTAPHGSPANGNASMDSYQQAGPVSQYSSQTYGGANGTPSTVSAANKRGREDEEEDSYSRPENVPGNELEGLKRRRTMDGGAVQNSIYADTTSDMQSQRATQRTRR